MTDYPYSDVGDLKFYAELRELEHYVAQPHNFFRPGFDLKVEQLRMLKEEEGIRYWRYRERKAAGFREMLSGIRCPRY